MSRGKSLLRRGFGALTRSAARLKKGRAAKTCLILALSAFLVMVCSPGAFAFEGTVSGIFTNPQPNPNNPSAMRVWEIDTNNFVYGGNEETSDHNHIKFYDDVFSDDVPFYTFPSEPFYLGKIEYFNTTTPAGTSPVAVDLVIDLTFTDPAGIEQEFTYALDLIQTSNNHQDPEDNADYVVFPFDTSPNETVILDGVAYTLKLTALENVTGHGWVDIPDNPNHLYAYEEGDYYYVPPQWYLSDGTVTAGLWGMLELADVYRYEYICQYNATDPSAPSNGDSYTGYFYDYHAYEQDDVVLTFTDENGQEGLYKITATYEEPEDPLLQGQVFVDSYFDYESDNTYTLDDSNPVSVDFLGSESDYIIEAGVDDFFFGNQDGVMYEADLAVEYNFIHFYEDGCGDWYSGTVYAPQGFYGDTLPTTTENDGGHYEIGVAAYLEDVSQYGQVTVEEYFDGESLNTYLAADGKIIGGAGDNYLGSESGYIIMDEIPEYFFGAETPGDVIFEADLVAYAYDFQFDYSNGDCYTGTVYAEPERYGGITDNPLWSWTVDVEDGLTGAYAITEATGGYEVALAGQVTVDTYDDSESGATFLAANGEIIGSHGDNYLGSESGYIITAGVPEYFFGAETPGGIIFEADLTAYTYYFTFTYGNGDYYHGTLYAAPEEGYGVEYTQTAIDENGREGYYEITGQGAAVDGLAGQVFVDTYYDEESDNFYTPLHAGTAVGDDYLGSERDYLLLNGYVLNRFGIGPVGSEEVLYEADVTYAQDVYNRHREPFRTIRLNSLHRCYILQGTRHPELFDDAV